MAKRRSVNPLPKLGVKYILDTINQEDIFSVYSGIPLSHISAVAGTNKKLSAPYRNDSDPSFGFTYRYNGKLVGRDFGGYFWGDCFDFVAFTLNKNVYVKNDFGQIMEDIARTFGIHSYATATKKVAYKKLDIEIKKKPVLRIQVRVRKWIRQDGEYWYNRFGVTQKILKYYKVFPVQFLYFNGNEIYEFRPDDPAYAYYLGIRDGIEYWKVYYPYRDKGQRFHSNGGVVQGIHQITPAPFGLITKSLKDVMCAASISVQAIAPASEGGTLTIEQVNYLRSKWNFLISLMDFDRTGRILARKLRRDFNIPSIFITNGEFHTFDFGKGVKDLSDYHDKYGRNQTILIKDKIIECGFESNNELVDFIMKLKHY